MNHYKWWAIIFLLCPAISIFAEKILEPIHQSISVQSPITPASKGLLGIPPSWSYAHIKCSVYSIQSNDRFSIVDGYGQPHSKNEYVDSRSMGNKHYFVVAEAGKHSFEFDMISSFGRPLKLYILNGSAESLAFSDCIAISE